MVKAIKKRRKILTHVSVMMSINGNAVDYQYTEYDDGRFVEKGLPLGMISKPSPADIFRHMASDHFPPKTQPIKIQPPKTQPILRK